MWQIRHVAVQIEKMVHILLYALLYASVHIITPSQSFLWRIWREQQLVGRTNGLHYGHSKVAEVSIDLRWLSFSPYTHLLHIPTYANCMMQFASQATLGP